MVSLPRPPIDVPQQWTDTSRVLAREAADRASQGFGKMFSPNHLRGVRVAFTLDNQIAENALWGLAMLLAKILTPEGASQGVVPA